MSFASLRIGSSAWRAARASAALGAYVRGDTAPDTALGALAPLGVPPRGWLSVLGSIDTTVVLILPRPGDPRGLALPRGVHAGGAVGWQEVDGSRWLLPSDPDLWREHDVAGHLLEPHDLAEAHRSLRGCVVEAAHIADVTHPAEWAQSSGSRDDGESLVDSWVLGPPALPAEPRQVAALGLRILLAADALGAIVDAATIDAAARTAVEAAYSTRRRPR
ncbi:MAG: hypothetical protein FJW85_11835 [Actinobacteria bacterium]|nr:hypothetical protein [Actinomycetota bacterium]